MIGVKTDKAQMRHRHVLGRCGAIGPALWLNQIEISSDQLVALVHQFSYAHDGLNFEAFA